MHSKRFAGLMTAVERKLRPGVNASFLNPPKRYADYISATRNIDVKQNSQ
ncbi:hypothetical protein [Caballeronia sp. LZ001]|nr:hypothetical protein [Caballeronia sp. LZ001]MDR5803582.1 hypothetical protein [Caballeronia sp. LZ001]